jgi:hypothetical protein
VNCGVLHLICVMQSKMDKDYQKRNLASMTSTFKQCYALNLIFDQSGDDPSVGFDVSGVYLSGLPWCRCVVVVGTYACDCTLVSSIGVLIV